MNKGYESRVYQINSILFVIQTFKIEQNGNQYFEEKKQSNKKTQIQCKTVERSYFSTQIFLSGCIQTYAHRHLQRDKEKYIYTYFCGIHT